MATQTIENFNTLDLETLASVEGGRVNWERWGMCGASVAVGARDIVLFVIAQVVSISLLVLFFSQLLHNLSSVFQLVYIVAALLVVVVDILLIRKIMTRREEPTVLNQLKASLACFLLLTLSCLRFLTTDFYYQKVIAIFVGFFSLLGFVLFLWGIKYINHNIEK